MNAEKKIYLVALEGNDVFLHSDHFLAYSKTEAEALALEAYRNRTIEILKATALETNLKALPPVRPIKVQKVNP